MSFPASVQLCLDVDDSVSSAGIEYMAVIVASGAVQASFLTFSLKRSCLCLNLKWVSFGLQAKVFSSHADDSDDSWDETDDEEFQAPIDNVDPFIFFSDVMKG